MTMRKLRSKRIEIFMLIQNNTNNTNFKCTENIGKVGESLEVRRWRVSEELLTARYENLLVPSCHRSQLCYNVVNFLK